MTITRPNGARKSYTTPAVFTRKNEAKAQTTALAIEMGALEFIATGETDSSKIKNGLVLAPLQAHDGAAAAEAEAPVEPEDPAVIRIEECCVEWRVGRVKPYWVALKEQKFGSSKWNEYQIGEFLTIIPAAEQGSALRIELSPHSLRVYSTDTKYDTLSEAKAACARLALDQGILEFIKHGNGQVDPEKPLSPTSDADVDVQEAETKTDSSPLPPLTLQAFYETFPQPFPGDFGDKSAAEINAPSWLNTAIQSARGAKLSSNFVWTTNGIRGGSLVGCKQITSQLFVTF